VFAPVAGPDNVGGVAGRHVTLPAAPWQRHPKRGSTMRMSPNKVKDLAGQIVAMMAAHEKIHLNEDETALRVVVGGVILDDLEEEDDIDREVDQLLRKHAGDIEQGDIDVELLRKKFRSEIARRRGVVL
jgi:hypothetical protein